MKTYDDIITIDRYNIYSVIEAEELITSADLLIEACKYCKKFTYPAEYLVAGAYNEESIHVLYLPVEGSGYLGRAGIAWGADAQWTDAENADDALERYFGVDGKEMVN